MREHPTTMASIRRWLEALTEHALASSELQQYQQELTMENLQALNRVMERPRGPDSAS
jgi:TorA maturation chaperone TorD